MESRLRRRREEIHLLEKGGASEDDILAAKEKYHALSDEYAEFSKAFDLPQQRERINIQRSGGVDVSFGKPLEKPEKPVAKSVDSGIIREQSKKQITQTTDKSIHNIPKVKITGYSDEQCLLIQNHHKELLRYSRDNNSCNEVAFVFSKDLSKKTTFLGTDDKIDFGYLPGSDLFVMHNHPRNSSFSATDIRFLLDSNYQRIKSFSIVKNNGSIEIITKTSSFNVDLLRIDFIRMLKKQIKNETEQEFDKVVKKFLIKHSKQGGMLEWIKHS